MYQIFYLTKTVLLSLPLLVLLLVANACGQGDLQADDWPMFRGPGGRSVAQAADLPLEWSIEDGTNIAWQADLPGRGVSGPIVVGGKVIVTASSGPNRERLHVAAFDVETGQPLWHRQFWATGKSICHATSANAAPTPASDGKRIFAFFSSNDLIALDLDGNLLWVRGLELDYVNSGNALGMSSSPVVAGDVVVVQSQAQGNSFVAAIDRRDGSTRWDVERPKEACWCSPIAIEDGLADGGEPAVVLQSPHGIDFYGANSGKQLLQLETDCETIASLTFDKYLYAPSQGVQVFDILAAKSDAEIKPIWKATGLKPASPSPVISDGQVFVVNRGGVLSCGMLETQKVAWKLRLSGQFWATPILVGKHLYCVNSDGKSFVVALGEPGKKGTIVGESEFGEDILGSPAVAAGALFVRSHTRLWKIAK